MAQVVEVEPIQYESRRARRTYLAEPASQAELGQPAAAAGARRGRQARRGRRQVRVMVFRGREGTFCSGFDLDELQGDFIGKRPRTRSP